MAPHNSVVQESLGFYPQYWKEWRQMAWKTIFTHLEKKSPKEHATKTPTMAI